MIEEIVLNHLIDVLEVPVYMEVPENVPLSFVVIEKTGTSRSNWIDSATFALQSYSETLYEAALLNEKVKAAMDRLVESPTVFKSALNSDYNFTDPDTKRYRYQAIYNLVFKEA